MEKKYNPDNILLGTYARFLFNDEIYNYEIFIKIKKSKECYRIKSERNKPISLWKGICTGSNWRLIQDSQVLFSDKDLLGEVYIQHNKEEMIRNKAYLVRKIIKKYKNYEEFWKDVER